MHGAVEGITTIKGENHVLLLSYKVSSVLAYEGDLAVWTGRQVENRIVGRQKVPPIQQKEAGVVVLRIQYLSHYLY